MNIFDDIETNELGPRPYVRNPTSSPQCHRLARKFRQFEVPLRREKFEAMVKLGVANSRMKDFYDLQVLSSGLAFDGKTLGLTKIHLPFSVFAAIHHDSHDTYMTPLCHLRNRCDVDLFTPVDRFPRIRISQIQEVT